MISRTDVEIKLDAGLETAMEDFTEATEPTEIATAYGKITTIYGLLLDFNFIGFNSYSKKLEKICREYVTKIGGTENEN